MGSGVYCLRGTDFKQLINELVMEGGDSDTNAAVAGALLGCKIGYNQLPQDWLAYVFYYYYYYYKIIINFIINFVVYFSFYYYI